MKKLVMAGAALAMMASTAIAERYVMITHTQGTDPFWPVVEKGGRDAAAAIGADFEYIFTTSGDMAEVYEPATFASFESQYHLQEYRPSE